MGADDEPVMYGRWQAEHAALEARVIVLEQAAARRGERSWALILTVLAGLALPVLILLGGAAVHRLLSS